MRQCANNGDRMQYFHTWGTSVSVGRQSAALGQTPTKVESRKSAKALKPIQQSSLNCVITAPRDEQAPQKYFFQHNQTLWKKFSVILT